MWGRTTYFTDSDRWSFDLSPPDPDPTAGPFDAPVFPKRRRNPRERIPPEFLCPDVSTPEPKVYVSFWPDPFPLERRKSIGRLDASWTDAQQTPPVGPNLGADSVRFYFSGAGSDGGAQADDNASLGGYRSSTEAARVGWITAVALSGVRIVQASRWNGADGATGSLLVDDDDTIAYTAPDGANPGAGKFVANGETVTLEDGDDPSAWIRVTRTSANPLIGAAQFEFTDQFNNLFGMKNCADSDRAAGENRYRAVMVRNELLVNLQSLKFWIGTLGPSAVSSAAQLSSSGSGTITGAANCFVAWPWKGWARIQTSGGTLREIVYYSSRTSNSLTVPSLGRGRLGTSAAAGGATDVCYPVPGVRIAYEAASPVVGGSVQTIADEETAPTGVTWKTGIDAAGGASAGALAGKGLGAVWIHREIPAGASGCAKHDVRIECEFVLGSQTYRETLAGMFRIAEDALSQYEFFVGVDALPDLTGAPDATASPPEPPTNVNLPYATGHTYYVVVRARNPYDLVSEPSAPTIVVVSGGSVVTYPTAPEVIAFEPIAGGKLRLRAAYYWATDFATPTLFAAATPKWLIYARYNGTNPDPSSDTPTIVSADSGPGASFLDWESPSQTNGTTAKVIVRIRWTVPTNRDSTNVDVHTAIAATGGPAVPTGGIFYRGIAEQEQD